MEEWLSLGRKLKFLNLNLYLNLKINMPSGMEECLSLDRKGSNPAPEIASSKDRALIGLISKYTF